jgi:hypothetical protein
MPPYKKPSIDDIFKKYGAKIDGQINTSGNVQRDYSKEYVTFKDELSPELTRYEKWCRSLGSLIKLKISEKDQQQVKRSLQIAHIDIDPSQALALAIMCFVGAFILGLLISVAVVLINGTLDSFPVLFFFLSIIVALFLFYFVRGYPARLANKWRLKASSQMVPAILYIVVYMRHTPNFEKAIEFASEHLEYPLALDFKKVFYDVEIGKFSTLKESLDNYLETWKDYSTEFIESFYLIEGSLYEPEEARRIASLEKALQVVLDGVYDKMLKFTHNVRSPLTNVYMLGVVLPTLGLALLPLASAMLGGLLQWYHIFVIFNLIVPFLVFYLTDKIIFLRPGGYGETKLLERNPLYSEYASRKHYVNAFILCLPFFIIGLLPLIFQFTPLPGVLGLQKDYTFSQLGLNFFGDESIFGFINGNGPFGVGALICGMFFPLGISLFFIIAYRDKTKNLILERKATRELENEFNNSLFQLGNRIGSGTPPELAFGKVAQSSNGLRTEDFFRRVNYNVSQMGMSVEKAIFDTKRGAIVYYPSDLIATSMKVLIESAKKGLKIAASSLMSISEYVKNIQKITQRLNDMLAEIASDMKSNMTFLAPLLSGIVVGLAAMITTILSKLKLSDTLAGASNLGVGNLQDILKLFNISEMVPPYYLQIIVGIYLIQIIFILTRTLVTVDSGEDKLEAIHQSGINLKIGVMLYFITALLSTIVLFILSAVVLSGIVS